MKVATLSAATLVSLGLAISTALQAGAFTIVNIASDGGRTYGSGPFNFVTRSNDVLL